MLDGSAHAGRGLGQPLPDSPHAVSVSLPTWADNIGYERGEPRIIERMRSGYPRFFLHPFVSRLFEECERRFAKDAERCFVFPSRRVAERALEFVRRHTRQSGRIDRLSQGAWSACAPADSRDELKAYWQHSGQIVSSRMADRILRGREPSTDGIEEKRALRARVAQLMDVTASDVWLFPSGMAAIETAFRALHRLRPTGRSIQFGFPYVDSLKVQQRFGLGAHFFPIANGEELQQLHELTRTERVLGLFCEFPGNPLLVSPDLAAIDAISRDHDFPLLVDDTLGALVNVNVLPRSDLVSCSLTKYFSGAGDVMGGALVLNSFRPKAAELRNALVAEYEDLLDPEDAAVLERNSRDCVERVRQINETTERLCDVLRAHPNVVRIDYPKYRTTENYRACLRPKGGYGGLFSLLVKDAERNAPVVFDSLEIAKGPNLGTNFTLCCPYTLLAHFRELDFVESCGISRYLLRVSVGLEDPDWLIGRFRDALSKAMT